MIKIHSSPHRQNSDFQLRYFLAGDCKTPDGAYALMYAQKIDIETKLRHSEAQRLRRDAKIAISQDTIVSATASKAQCLNAQADIAEALADLPVWELNLQAAKNELAAIEQIMAELEPLRKYSNLDILGASEAAQREEWLLELMCRIENFMMTTGSIPADQLNTMRSHPDFLTHIVPHVELMMTRIGSLISPTDGLKMLTQNVTLLSKGD